MELKNKIQKLASDYHTDVTEIRRYIHANPELSFEEYNTSKFITNKLNEIGISYKDGYVKTGIVATITGTAPPPKIQTKIPCIALRADMDALPITEQNEVAYKSKNVGVMHACGHDVHSACLLGAAKILNEIKNEFSGTIKLFFQPGEEKAPGGASLMIKEGVLENPKPDAIMALHVFPSLEAGKVGFRPGKYMASTDEIYLTVNGKGGHAAMKGNYTSPLLIGAEILLKLEEFFSKAESSEEGANPTVLAFGKIIGSGSTNVIPDYVKIEGTLRTMNNTWREKAKILIKQIAADKAKNMGGSCDVTILNGYPALINDERITRDAKRYAEEYLSTENVIDLNLRMTGEDFSYFAEKIPACFFRLGTDNASRGITSGVHTPTFDIDEKALETGMGLLAWLTIQQLKELSK